MASYGIDDPNQAITVLAQSAMRKEAGAATAATAAITGNAASATPQHPVLPAQVGNLELDQLFLEREKLNQGIANALDQAAPPPITASPCNSTCTSTSSSAATCPPPPPPPLPPAPPPSAPLTFLGDAAVGHPSWVKMASTLFDDTAPSARLVPPGARAAPTYPSAQPGQLGSLRWPLLARLSLLRR